MRIGIVTQPLGYNYGGLLQNFAMQQALKNIGYDSITIDVAYNYSLPRYYVSYAVTSILKFFGKQRLYPTKPCNGRITPAATRPFINNFLKLTKPYKDYNQVDLDEYDIETLLVGSDQVWRPRYNSSIDQMFLSFADDKYKKMAYAASFGTNLWEFSKEETSRCAKLIEKFKCVSIREKSGVSLVGNYLKYSDVQFVLDPTLLLTKESYFQLCSNIPVSQKRYLCAYILDNNEEKTSRIYEIAKQLNLEVMMFSAHDDLKLSVEEWLSCFRDALYVATDSFHGTVFSIIFNKEFVVIPNGGRGKDRFDSLLETCNLVSRMNYLEFNQLDHIDWDAVELRLSQMRKQSMQFLEDNLV